MKTVFNKIQRRRMIYLTIQFHYIRYMYLGMGIVKLTLLPNDLYFYFSIAVCLRGKLNYEDGKININCSCGYITNHLWCGCLYNFFIFSIICYFLTNNNVIYIEDEHLHYLITLSRCCLKNWGFFCLDFFEYSK